MEVYGFIIEVSDKPKGLGRSMIEDFNGIIIHVIKGRSKKSI